MDIVKLAISKSARSGFFIAEQLIISEELFRCLHERVNDGQGHSFS